MANHILLAAITLLLLTVGCTSNEPADPVADGVLSVGTDATYPPFEMVNPETGNPEGFDMDMITEVCRVHNWQPEFLVTPFDGIVPGLIGHKYDVIVSAMTITPERAAVVDFSTPYYTAGQTIAVPLDDTTITSVEDLVGKRVGVQLGTTGQLMAKRMTGLQVFSYENIGAAFLDMRNGNLDAVLNDYPTTRAYIKRHGDARTVGELLSTEQYGIAVRRADDSLLALINAALDTLHSNGTLDSLHVKWFGVPYQKPDTAMRPEQL